MARRRRNNRRRRRGSFAPFYKLLCLVVIVAAIVVALSLFFKVEHIAVDGNSRYTNVEVVNASGVKQGDNLFLMNKYNVAGRISGALPYVEAVSINRDLPDTLQIHIQECVCSIALEQEGTTWILCSSGKVADEIAGGVPEDCTAVIGLTIMSPQVGAVITADEDGALARRQMLEKGWLTEEEADAWDEECRDEVQRCVTQAQKEPTPRPQDEQWIATSWRPER